jgi:hypothetical protein
LQQTRLCEVAPNVRRLLVKLVDKLPKVMAWREELTEFRAARSDHWIKVKNPTAPAVKREAEEDWGAKRKGRGHRLW